MPRRKRWYSQNSAGEDAAPPQDAQGAAGETTRQQDPRQGPRRPRKNNQPRPQPGDPAQEQQAAPPQGGQPPRPRRPRRNNQPPPRPALPQDTDSTAERPPLGDRPAADKTTASEQPRTGQPGRQGINHRRNGTNRQADGQRRFDRSRKGRRIFSPAGGEGEAAGEQTTPAAEQAGESHNPPAREQGRQPNGQRRGGQDAQRREGARRDAPRRGSQRGLPPSGIAPHGPRQQGQPRGSRQERRPDLRATFSEYTNPIPTNKGIKARSQRGAFSKNWWARRWIEAMERIVDPHRLQRGRSYARQGQVLSIDETAIGIEARVQGSRPQPYKVTMQLTPLTDEQWDQVIGALAEQAIFTAQLLAGEMPEDIEAAFLSAGVSLFPYQAGDLYTDCTCPDWANPCKHVAATHYILGDRFDDDPFLLFRMRGRNQDQILQLLRERRSGGAVREELVEEGEPVIEEVLPLSEEISHFWEPLESLDTFPLTIRPPTVDMPMLKRLGEPAFLGGGSIEDILRPVYTTFSRSAFRAAYSEEEPLESSVNGGENGNGSNGEGRAAETEGFDGSGAGDANGDDSDVSLY